MSNGRGHRHPAQRQRSTWQRPEAPRPPVTARLDASSTSVEQRGNLSVYSSSSPPTEVPMWIIPATSLILLATSMLFAFAIDTRCPVCRSWISRAADCCAICDTTAMLKSGSSACGSPPGPPSPRRRTDSGRRPPMALPAARAPRVRSGGQQAAMTWHRVAQHPLHSRKERWGRRRPHNGPPSAVRGHEQRIPPTGRGCRWSP
jgi:hypothetical protein